MKLAAERYLMVLVMVVLLILLVCKLVHTHPSFSDSPRMIRIRVHQGDTLWTYAKRYGNPDTYILKRVHKIAEINQLDVNEPLEPGQELLVPTKYKMECAQLSDQ